MTGFVYAEASAGVIGRPPSTLASDPFRRLIFRHFNREEDMPLRKYTKGLFDAYDLVHSEIELKALLSFERLFTEHPPKAGASGYKFVKIASDFEPDLDRRGRDCSLQIEDLPIYREQADLVREHVQSHLDNTRYVQMKKERKQGTWTRCFKLDRKPGNRGIDCNADTYRSYRRVALVLPLRDSTTKFRDCVEWGFDAVFGKPVACNEIAPGRANRPWT